MIGLGSDKNTIRDGGNTGLLQMIFCHTRHPSHLCQDPDSLSRTFLEQGVLVIFLAHSAAVELIWKSVPQTLGLGTCTHVRLLFNLKSLVKTYLYVIRTTRCWKETLSVKLLDQFDLWPLQTWRSFFWHFLWQSRGRRLIARFCCKNWDKEKLLPG